jgi:hypothetical protein
MKTKNNEDQEQIKKFEENEKEFKRVYRDQIRKIDHDLYKLEVAVMQQDKGIEGRSTIFVPVEHCHFFHSVDSRGAVQKYATSIGGHTHKIDIQKREDGSQNIICGPSIIVSNGKTYQMKNSESVHTHKVIYVGSDVIDVTPVNKEAAKVLGIR